MNSLRVGSIVSCILFALIAIGCGEMADGDLSAGSTAEEYETTQEELAYCSGSKIRIRSRSSWGASGSRGYRSRHYPNRISIHHTVTANSSSNSAAMVRHVQREHFARGFSDIGYHFLVDRKGRIYRGTDERRNGAHVLNQNSGNLGIALLGSYHLSTKPTNAQLKAVAALVRHLAKKYNIPISRSRVRGHGERMATACPGHQVLSRLNDIVRWARNGSARCNAKKYRSKLWVRLARHADDTLKDGKSKGVADVFEYQRPKGYIYYKNQSNRTLKNVYLKYDYSENYLHARKYLIQRKKKGQRRWRTSGKLHGDSRNPARNKFGSRSTLFLGDMKPGEYRRIVIYFKAKQYSLHKKHDVRLRAWIRTISGGVYRGGRTYGTKPKKNKFKRRKRAQAKIDILAKEEWRFNGPTRKDTEGWRSCNNSSTGPRRIYKRTSRNGALVVEVRGKNGCVKSPKWTKINADGYDELVLRVKSKHGPHKSAVYFNTRKDQRWSSSRGVIFDARGDGTWQMLVIPMGEHPEWKGMIRRIRIDPLEGQGPRTGGIEKHQIDKVFLQRSDKQKTSSPREDYVTRTPVPVELSL